ncbi:hypothetical protein EV182_000727 [Spiromyces aspiralis]|uniref:Uncharacterized protein n=1 Tax=Spiromyces aspiralis TaxID=68401 RepID=A0ACC1HP43_9FUNG|nr:hypothetical protein EV182_000727 [Spiromyces aspiralis]
MQALHWWASLAQKHPVVTLMTTNGILGGSGDALAQWLQWQTVSKPDTSTTTSSTASSSNDSDKSTGPAYRTVLDISAYHHRYDWKRTLRFVAWGALCAPLMHKWYLFLNGRFPIPSVVPTPSPPVPSPPSAAAAAAAKFAHTSLKAAATNAAALQSSGFGSFSHYTLVTKLQNMRPVVANVMKRVATDQLLFAPISMALFFTAISLMEGQGLAGIRYKLRHQYQKALLANYVVWPAVQTVNFTIIPPIFRVPFASVVGLFWNTILSWINERPSEARSTTDAAIIAAVTAAGIPPPICIDYGDEKTGFPHGRSPQDSPTTTTALPLAS